MKGLAVEELEVTTLDQSKQGPKMEFTHRSGTRPLPGYTIKRGLGWGGFGEVYYAVSDGGKEVALKLVQRHLDVELRGVSHCLNLKHPHLVSTFDVIRTPKGESWIIMEYMAGQSLQERLEATNGALSLDESLHWLQGIADAIDFLHNQGIVHRDLKPGNVFSENSNVKVGDYGLSKFISTSRRSGQTQSVGTVHYMAPEISTGNYGKSVDVYSAAIMAYEMLSGDVPFDGETAGEVLMKHLTASPNLEKCDDKLRPIFEKALAKDPSERFGTVGELLRTIRLVLKGEEVAEVEATAAPPPAAKSVPSPIPQDLKQSLPPTPGTFKAKRREFSETVWRLFHAGILSMILPIIALTASLVFTDQSPELTRYVSMAVMTGIGSWGILSMARFWEQRRADVATRRLNTFLFGLVMAAVAFGVNAYLQRPMGEFDPVVLASGDWSEESMRLISPVALIYASLFGLTFGIPDWARCACTGRRGRFSVWRAIWPGAVAVVLSTILSIDTKGLDPMWVGAVLTMTAVTVQWVAPLVPSKKRHRFAHHA